MTTQNIDQFIADDLELFIINDEPSHRLCERIAENYARKKARGVYNPSLAVKGYINAVVFGIAQYRRELGRESLPSRINKATKEAVAKELLAYFVE